MGYISLLSPYVKEKDNLTSRQGKKQKVRHIDQPMVELHKEFGISPVSSGYPFAMQEDPEDEGVAAETSSSLTPFADIEGSAAEFAYLAVKQLLEQEPALASHARSLLYGFVTAESSYFLTPCLFLKQAFHLRQLTPFAISHSGASVLTDAIQMLEHDLLPATAYAAAEVKEWVQEDSAIVVLCDRMQAPLPRQWHQRYPFGGSSVACKWSRSSGDWFIRSWKLDFWPLPSPNPYRWSLNEEIRQEQYLITRTKKTLQAWMHAAKPEVNRIRIAIVQAVSANFIEEIQQLLSPIPVYTRLQQPRTNLLSADGLISLSEAQQHIPFQPGDQVLLMMAGPMQHCSLLLLEATDKVSF
ncbi:hypothetical protein [Marinicrinis sediminis]|uniref:Uncharacterized protein n=1 Tax=Marinicrinis sediminis TaxID=1652465 RepID=A0ABW5RE47_9BACL